MGTSHHLLRGAVAAALGIVAPLLTAPAEPGPADAAGLVPFASCAALRDWYVARTIGQVGPYGWSSPILFARRAVAPAAAGPDVGVASSATGTNTQEAGVDEPDVAKTDGRVVVRLQGQSVVVTDVSGASPRQLSTWTLPAASHADGLLLVDGHVLLAAEHGAFVGDGGGDGTEVYDLDVSAPATPRLVAHTTWSGSALSLRQYGDVVRLVTSTGLPDLAFVRPHRGLSAAAATDRNREVVRESTIEEWLPSVAADGAGAHPAVGCGRTYHPDLLDGATRDLATIGVFTLHPGSTSPADAVAVTGRGSQVYSAADRLYVWDSPRDEPMMVHPGLAGRGPFRPIARPHTDVHAFALDGDSTRYLASGRIDGQVRDSWSFDEHDGHLRVAVTWHPAPVDVPGDGVASDNGIVVLEEQGGLLVEVGRVAGLGRDEQVQAVRWFDDLAVLVTFRQTDPLFTVDLTDPARPRALGALRLPGFSSYLHPLGAGRLLGLGTAATTDGGPGGAKAAVFDVADPAHSRQLGEVGLGDSSWPAVAQDEHAFTWLGARAGSGTAITQVERPGGGAALLALAVDGNGHLSTRALPAVGGRQQRALPLPDGRVALVGDRVVLLATPGT